MPSIRRNLLGYLLLLLALALGSVGVLVDRYAQAAMRAREDAEHRRIEAAYQQREKEAGAKFDAELTSEAQLTARDALRNRLFTSAILASRDGPGAAVHPDPAEIVDYQRRVGALLGGLGLVNFADAPRPSAPAPAGKAGPGDQPPPPRLVNPFWVNYEAPRFVARIQDGLRKSLEDETEPRHRGELQGGEFQIHLVASDAAHRVRYMATARSAGLPHDLPADWDALERAAQNSPPDLLHDDVEIAGRGMFRRVVVRGPSPGRGPWDLMMSPPTLTPPNAPRPLPRPTGLYVRVYVQFVAPDKILSDRLIQDRADRADQLDRVRTEGRVELAQLRAKLTLIGCGTFAALVVGGWLIVARGLSPVRKLSDAVSRVSEKDFRLPVRDDELSRELVPIHSRLTQTLDLLRRAFAREKQAVADISHELRTPIASLLATLDVTLRKPRTPEQYRTTLEDCRAITRQLSQLVERIMTLASLDAGTARTNTVRMDASEITSGCAAVIRPLAAAHGLTLEVRAAPPLELDTDPDKLREVLINLLHNAVEYNRPDGTVELLGRRENDRIVLEVRDTGIGMTPEVRERIFERFFRADPSRHATGVHAGLGLAIVKEYVERLGGTITVVSEAGVGSTFRVELPAAPEEPEELAPPATVARPDARAAGNPVPSGS